MSSRKVKVKETIQNAELLKAQGNELHQKGQYQAAYRKYTAAINEDPENAIYYANRAASSLSLKQYLDAIIDCRKATELDPGYAKAWARLGTANAALTLWEQSTDAWRKALSTLPPPDLLTESDKTLKLQFEAGLEYAQKAEKEPITIKTQIMPTEDAAWKKAMALEEQFANERKLSSAFVILSAYREFNNGVETMKLTKRKYMNGKTTWVGKPDALVDLSNGILRDSRAFHIDIPHWLSKFEAQVMLESQFHKAWTNQGVKALKDEAPQRLKHEGWDSVRRALTTTVRAWFMGGFINCSNGKYVIGMEYLTRVVDVLNWGRRIWQNVSVDDRGVIFELSFIRGVKRQRLIFMHQAIHSKTPGCEFTMVDLAKSCHDLIAEVEAHPPTPGGEYDIGFLASFWSYPKAEALVLLGWCHMQLGFKATTFEIAEVEFSESAKYYIQAADTFLEDDEKRPSFLNIVLEAYWFQGRPLKDVLPLIARIREAIPKMILIWKTCASSKERDFTLQQALSFGEKCEQAVNGGRLTLSDIVKPKSIKKTDKWAANAIYI